MSISLGKYIIKGNKLIGSNTLIKRLQVLQKKAVRALVGARYNANTSPIFRRLKILRISDLIDLEQAKLSYKFVHNELPPGISMLFLPNAFNHRYNTRAIRNPRVAKHKTSIIHKSFLIKSPTIWSDLPLIIKSATTVKALKNRFTKHKIASY